MKILFISDVYFPRVNGVSTSIQTFRHHLHLHGHTVHLMAPDYGKQSVNEAGITRVPASPVPLDREDGLMSYRWVMKRFKHLSEEKYDIIHIQTPFVAHYLGTRLSRMLGIPCVETYHTFFEEYLYHYIPFIPRKWMRSLARRFSRRQCNSLDGMIVPSQPMLEVLKNYGVTTKSEVISTGIEPASFEPGNRFAFREKYNISQDRPVLLFVGRVAHEKNIGFLLEMLAEVRKEIPDVLLVVTGEGPARKSLMHSAAERGLNSCVQFLGYLDRDTELNDCYNAADIFVFSSRTETQGLVLLEAMAQGTPVVSTAELGTREVLREGEGVWIAQEEVADFAGKVVRMLQDSEARKALGETARHYAQGWSASRQAERLLQFYQAVLVQEGSNEQSLVMQSS